jgi:hypothetical protein
MGHCPKPHPDDHVARCRTPRRSRKGETRDRSLAIFTNVMIERIIDMLKILMSEL